MFLIWATYILEIIFLSLLKPVISDFSSLAIIATIIHVVFTLLVLLTFIKKNTSILIWAFLIRVFFLFFDLFGRDIFIIPNSGSDTENFYIQGLEVADNLNLLWGNQMNIYSKITGFIFNLIGPQRIFVQYLNVLLGITAIYIVHLILEELRISNKIQYMGLILFSFMPNAVIVSSIFLREAFPTFLVSLAILSFVKWINSSKTKDMVISLVMLALASVFHSGVIGILLGLGFAYLFYDNNSKKFVFSNQTIFYGIILLFMMTLAMTVFDEFIFGKFQGVENADELYNKASGYGRASSVYLPGLEVNNIFDFIFYSPIKAIYFYFSPAPWDWRGITDFITFLTDSMIYIITIILFVFSIDKNYTRKNEIILFLIMIIGGGIIFGTGVDNAGTAMRHRQKLIPVFIPMALMVLDSEYSHRYIKIKGKFIASTDKWFYGNKEGKMESRKYMEKNYLLSDFLSVLKKNIIKIFTGGVVGIVLASIVTFLVMKPMYSSTVDLVVNEANNQQIDQSTIQTNLSLLNTYEGIIKKPNVLEKVIEDTGLDLSVDELSEATTVSNDENSLLLSISVTGDSPYVAAELANSIGENFVNEVQNILQVNNVFIWNLAEPNTSAISPNIPFNLIIGFLIGVSIAIFYYILNYIYDPSIKSESIIKNLGLTPLGTIPKMSENLYKETVLRENDSR